MKHGFARTMGFLMAAVLLLAMVLPAQAATTGKSGPFSYTLKGDGTASITGFDWSQYKDDENIVIPQMIDGYTVTDIGSSAFARGKGELDTEYHEGTYFAKVIIPGTVQKVREKAFFNSGIGYFTIPASVKTIEIAAFCTGTLRNVTVDNNNENYASIDGSLYSKKDKELLALAVETTSIPNGIISIGEYSCVNGLIKLTKVKFPSSIEIIKNYAFSNGEDGDGKYRYTDRNGEGTIRFDHVKSIGDYAFISLRASGVTIYFGSTLSEIGRNAFSGARLKALHLEQCTKVTQIPWAAFANFRASEKTRLPSSITEIGGMAFANTLIYEFAFDHMKPITIGSRAFEKTGGVLDVDDNFFSRVESIGEYAFRGARFTLNRNAHDIKDVITLPSSCTFIGKGAFDSKWTAFKVQPGSYAEEWAQENGYEYDNGTKAKADTSWLN